MKYLLILSGLLLMISCSTERTLTQVKLKEGIRLINHFENNEDGYRKHYFIVYETNDSIEAIVKIEETKLRITPSDKSKLIVIDTIQTDKDLEIDIQSSFRLANKYSYKNELKKKGDNGKDLDLIKLDSSNSKHSIPLEQKDINKSYVSFNPVKYRSGKSFLQTLTVPFKFRGEVNNKPSNVSTGFNAGFAYGKLWNWQKVTPIFSTEDYKMKGYDKREFAIGVAPFLGLTTIILNSDNAQNEITVEKTVLGGTIGGVAVVKFNTINIGLGVGIDYGFSESSKWDYQGKPWMGLILGLNLIK